MVLDILLPGERGARAAGARQRDGIALAEPVCEELRRLGRPLGLEEL